MEIKEKAEALLNKVQVITIASTDECGYPRPVPMSKIANEGLGIIYLSTGNSSAKTAHFLSNPKAGISFYENGDSVVLTGKVEVVKDEQIKKNLWQDWFFEHFPAGVEDPEYAILKFTAENATLWIENEFVKETL